ncbi:hypothetical protein EBS43_12260 [bacterium]|nr:hypothetical protein [bacterium]
MLGWAEKKLPALAYKGKSSLSGRSNLYLQKVLTRIFDILTSGYQWRRLPREFNH